MSNHYTYIISADPKHQLLEEKVSHITKELKGYFQPEVEVTYEAFSKRRFVDSGQNFSQVACPYCNEVITDWWSDEMEKLHAVDFEMLYVTVPCCSLTTTISQLNYTWPCGFANYAFVIKNPGIQLSPQVMSKLENLLGTTLLLIRQHL